MVGRINSKTGEAEYPITTWHTKNKHKKMHEEMNARHIECEPFIEEIITDNFEQKIKTVPTISELEENKC